jgi:hypothetical protein
MNAKKLIAVSSTMVELHTFPINFGQQNERATLAATINACDRKGPDVAHGRGGRAL